jgi:SAM-dependent methyltransferase
VASTRSSSISEQPRELAAGDFDYEAGGAGYAQVRRADPRIAACIHAALGEARTVVNVGAGAGSYEPTDRDVTPVEPSAAMRAHRPPDLPVAVDAIAEDLPFADDSFDAAMATVTIHQWRDLDRGLLELRRVSRGPVVILLADREALADFWLLDYVPEVIRAEQSRNQDIVHVRRVLGGTSTVTRVPIPFDCTDGFSEAFYGRPERLLEESVRRAQSSWKFVNPDVALRGIAKLRADLESGEWDRKYGALRSQPAYVGSLRLLVAYPAPLAAEMLPG